MELIPKIKTLVTGAVLTIGFAASSNAALITGTTSKYYLSNYVNNTIYVVQGTTVVDAFSMAYRGGQGEGTLAVSNVISTRSFYSTDNDTGHDFWDGPGGTYTLDGTPTGNTYANDTTLAGRTRSDVLDGTSDGTSNYAVEYINGAGTESVIRFDENWQNPEALFTVSSGVCCEQLSIAYDPGNNSLWIGGWDFTTLWNYSMTGVLLGSFSTGHANNAALGFDAADGTLWLSVGQGNLFEQWSTSGVLLQSGAFAGLANGSYLSGDFAATPAPAPGAILLLGFGLLGLRMKRRVA